MQLGSRATDCIPSLLDVPDRWMIRLVDLLLKRTDDLTERNRQSTQEQVYCTSHQWACSSRGIGALPLDVRTLLRPPRSHGLGNVDGEDKASHLGRGCRTTAFISRLTKTRDLSMPILIDIIFSTEPSALQSHPRYPDSLIE